MASTYPPQKLTLARLIYCTKPTTKKWKIEKLYSKNERICSEVSVNSPGNHGVDACMEEESWPPAVITEWQQDWAGGISESTGLCVGRRLYPHERLPPLNHESTHRRRRHIKNSFPSTATDGCVPVLAGGRQGPATADRRLRDRTFTTLGRLPPSPEITVADICPLVRVRV